MTRQEAVEMVDNLLQASLDYEMASKDEDRLREYYLAARERVISELTTTGCIT